ncbi:MAG TPA: hypothetical protein VG034_17170 [Acidimicrobiia bacterium]|jgi:hypothetical protein|nr:hypothetical protein [Acidimicrobiia bacterium]
MELKQWLRAQWDRVGAVGCIGLGLVVLLAGWIGVSDEALPAAQIPYILSGGVLGIILVGIGATGWLSADLRDEWRKLDDLEGLLGQIIEQAPGEADAAHTESGHTEVDVSSEPQSFDARRAMA